MRQEIVRTKRRLMTVSELLAYAQRLTPGQLAVLGLNTRADGTQSEHGCLTIGEVSQ
jgi:hypothetical protein